MSKICRTFAPKIETTMTKRTYIQPKMTAQPVLADMSVMLLNSNSAPETSAPARRLNNVPAALANDSAKVF